MCFKLQVLSCLNEARIVLTSYSMILQRRKITLTFYEFLIGGRYFFDSGLGVEKNNQQGPFLQLTWKKFLCELAW